jgi:DHA1 family bicyclomycin/chloramphenicol resistance-like MFS transporter
MAPMWAATRMIFSTPSFRAYTAALTLSYAGLFAYLSGSPFVFMRVFHWSATEYGLWLPVMATGFFVGSYSCRLLLPRYAIAGTVCRGALLQLASGGSMAALAIAGVHHPAAIIVPMFFFGISHGWIQPPSMAGAVAPFPERAGLASALFGALMMAAAAAIGYLIGASFNGTVYPLTLTIGATSVASALTAWTLVRRHGHV